MIYHTTAAFLRPLNGCDARRWVDMARSMAWPGQRVRSGAAKPDIAARHERAALDLNQYGDFAPARSDARRPLGNPLLVCSTNRYDDSGGAYGALPGARPALMESVFPASVAKTQKGALHRPEGRSTAPDDSARRIAGLNVFQPRRRASC